jgi:hypothetical protein
VTCEPAFAAIRASFRRTDIHRILVIEGGSPEHAACTHQNTHGRDGRSRPRLHRRRLDVRPPSSGAPRPLAGRLDPACSTTAGGSARASFQAAVVVGRAAAARRDHRRRRRGSLERHGLRLRLCEGRRRDRPHAERCERGNGRRPLPGRHRRGEAQRHEPEPAASGPRPSPGARARSPPAGRCRAT